MNEVNNTTVNAAWKKVWPEGVHSITVCPQVCCGQWSSKLFSLLTQQECKTWMKETLVHYWHQCTRTKCSGSRSAHFVASDCYGAQLWLLGSKSYSPWPWRHPEHPAGPDIQEARTPRSKKPAKKPGQEEKNRTSWQAVGL